MTKNFLFPTLTSLRDGKYEPRWILGFFSNLTEKICQATGSTRMYFSNLATTHTWFGTTGSHLILQLSLNFNTVLWKIVHLSFGLFVGPFIGQCLESYLDGEKYFRWEKKISFDGNIWFTYLTLSTIVKQCHHFGESFVCHFWYIYRK
jgi:hypothetical protein